MASNPVFPVSQLGLSHLATGLPKTLRLRSESPPEFQLRREAARRRLLAESALRFRLRHALLGLASAILRLEVALQNESAWVSPLSVHFWRPKAVFLWRLVAKLVKNPDPVTSGDMSGLYIGPEQYLALEGHLREGAFESGARAVPAGGTTHSAPGRLRASCPPALRPVRGVLPLGWDRRGRVTPAGTKSQETWPGAELRGQSLGERRGGAPRGERVPKDARPRPKRIWVATSDAWRGPTGQLRLPALRLPLFFGGKD
jgi:hypothetical protein